MKKEIHQKISSYLDNDLDSYEEETLLLKISKDSELINKLTRYQAVKHVLKQDSFINVKAGFLDKIKQEIDHEPHFLIPKQKVKKRQFGLWQKTSVAMVASAVIAVVLVPKNIELNQDNIVPAILASPNVSEVTQQLVKAKPERTHNKEQEIELVKAKIQESDQENDVENQLASDFKRIQHERLKAYLQAHSDNSYAYDDSVNFQPFASVVSQE